MNTDYSDMIADALGEVLQKHTWTGLRDVLLGDYNGVVIAPNAPYPRSINWHSSSFQTRESGTAVLPGNSEILYQENPAYASNPPPITIGKPEGSNILTVKGISSTLPGLSAQGNVSQPEQQVQSVGNPRIYNIADLRVDPPDGGGMAVKVNPGRYGRASAPGVVQAITSPTAVPLANVLSGIQHQLSLVYLDTETGLFGEAVTSPVNAGLGSVPSRSELDTAAAAASITLSASQKPLGFVYKYSGQSSVAFADIFYDLDPRFIDAGTPSSLANNVFLTGYTALATAGSWVISHDNAANLGNYLEFNGNGHAFDLSFIIAAGTYTISMFALTQGDCPIVDVKIDGVTIGSLDWYSGSLVYNITKTISSVAISDGYHKLSVVINGHNVSSSSFHMYFTALSITPSVY